MNSRETDWPASQIGRVVGGRWTILKVLATGGTSAVFEAVHRNGKRVAVKILHPERAKDGHLRSRFLHEGYAANKVGHRGAVVIDDDGEEPDGTAYLVMELLSGESPDQLAKKLGGRLPWRTVSDISVQLLEVLDCAHRRGIVHRDIKPGNLFLSPQGTLRVLDFGLARVADRSERGLFETGDAALLGTPAFMAPEQARASTGAIGPHTDLWGVGATAFTLLTGRRVYEAPTVDDQLALAATASAPRLQDLCSDVPPAVAGVFQRALEFDPADRFPSAAAMLEALRHAVRGLPGEPTTDAVDASGDVTFLNTVAEGRGGARAGTGQTRRPRVTLWVLAALAGALLLAAFGIARMRNLDAEATPIPDSPSTARVPSAMRPPLAEEPRYPIESGRAAGTAASAEPLRTQPGVVRRPVAKGATSPGGSSTIAAPRASGGMIEEPPF